MIDRQFVMEIVRRQGKSCAMEGIVALATRKMLWSEQLPQHKTRRGLHSVAIYSSEVMRWRNGNHEAPYMRTTLFIELKYDAEVNDDYLKGVMLDAAKAAAKILLTQASMVCTTRKPEIAVRTNNSIEGTEIIEVFSDEDREG